MKLLKRRLPPAVIRIGDAEITLSRKVASSIAQNAIEEARQAPSQLKAADDPVTDVVERVHVSWDHLKDLSAQLDVHTRNFAQAAKALRGEVVEATGPLVELALHARASFDAVKLVDPGYDLDRVEDVARVLDAVAEALTEETRIVKSRRVRQDTAARRVVLHAQALDHVSHTDLQGYEMPEDYTPPEIPRRKSMHDPLPDHTAIHRKAAKQYLAAERDQELAEKRQRKAQQRKRMRREISDIWGVSA